jgi:hypothetical protein
MFVIPSLKSCLIYEKNSGKKSVTFFASVLATSDRNLGASWQPLAVALEQFVGERGRVAVCINISQFEEVIFQVTVSSTELCHTSPCVPDWF